jgi:hypothetical protein
MQRKVGLFILHLRSQHYLFLLNILLLLAAVAVVGLLAVAAVREGSELQRFLVQLDLL